eukprot:6361908-Amphidinium_carterae.1
MAMRLQKETFASMKCWFFPGTVQGVVHCSSLLTDVHRILRIRQGNGSFFIVDAPQKLKNLKKEMYEKLKI